MSKCKKIKDMFDSAYLNELDKEQRLVFEHHLEECAECRAAFAENTGMLDFIKKKPGHEPGPVFWDDYWANLHTRMVDEDVLPIKSKKKKALSFPAFKFNRRWVFQAAAAMALLVMGIFIGREIFPPAAGPGVPGDRQPVLASQQAAGEQLFHRARHFIEQSKVMLLAIDNFDAETEDAFTLDLPFQQQVSQKLVSQAEGIKNDLDASGQRRLRDLINDLEIILLQVANLDPGADLEAVQLIRDGVKIRGVLFEIRLLDMNRPQKKRNRLKKI